jgi:hypothetical protein
MRYLSVIALLGFAPCVVPLISIQDDRTRWSLLISAFVSWLGFLATKAVIPTVKAYTLRAGLSGLDINKKGSEAGEKKIPESLGLASGVVFLVGGHGAAGALLYTPPRQQSSRLRRLLHRHMRNLPPWCAGPCRCALSYSSSCTTTTPRAW